jgi:hypothetical protein
VLTSNELVCPNNFGRDVRKLVPTASTRNEKNVEEYRYGNFHKNNNIREKLKGLTVPQHAQKVIDEEIVSVIKLLSHYLGKIAKSRSHTS